MPSPDLLMVCVSSLIAVFVILAILAVIMRFIVALFPVKTLPHDDVIMATVAAVVAQQYPGMRITNVEEIKC